MIPRVFTLKWPLTLAAVVQTERFLGEVSRSAMRFRGDTYTGNGIAGTVLALGMTAEAIFIHPASIGGGAPTSAVLAMRHAPDVSYVFGTGQTAGVVQEWTDTGIVLGSHAAANQAGQLYGYFALG